MDQEDLALPGLVHDLNNIFQTLVDSADLLSEDPRWKALSAAILRSVERGRRISESLQAGHGDCAPFDQILDDAIAFVEDSVLAGRGPGIRFIRDVEPGLELAGHWAWERVLINLFLNAMRAMPAGGAIHVEARRRGEDVCIEVRDTGSGIAPEVLEKLFEPYVSTKPFGTKKQPGGLGLHVVHTIVCENGGTVRAGNRTNAAGAEFVITIPGPMPGRVAHA
ncbi:MAG TPA: ATP-binding protein [Bryobacteraceae bacterium]|jgi:signal transduction histidine kinase